MNVLSLFDGMSCGQLALNRANIKYDTYYASEIDVDAIKVTQHNFPKTIQLGDVVNVKSNKLPKIDLLIGGSPCQGFSIGGKQLNFEDPRSRLFFEFVRLIDECKPKYWLLENVVMKKEYKDIISDYLGVQPVKINSALVSAQNRERLYWANFPITQPKDKGIKLIDVLEDTEMFRPAAIRGKMLNKKDIIDGEKKYIPCLDVRKNVNKSYCLTSFDTISLLTNMPVGKHYDAYKNNFPFRYFTTKEYCRLQTVPENYFSNLVSNTKLKRMIGNSWTIDVIVHIFEDMLRHDENNLNIFTKTDVNKIL